MQAELQPLLDNSISRHDFESIYLRAFELGLKGCTVFRPNEVRGSVLSNSSGTGIPCCPLER